MTPPADRQRILCVFGTRPEVIKMAPVVRALRASALEFNVSICLTSQHRELVNPLLTFFNLVPDDDLDVMRADQTLSGLTAALFTGLGDVMARRRPDWVIVQGDTTSAMVGAMSAFYHRVRVGHVEAGLRTGRMDQPFPEEMNRVVIARIADLHFAPTPRAKDNLVAEGIDQSKILVTGNTAIDSLQWGLAHLPAGDIPGNVKAGARLILVTLHRRESFGPTLEGMCRAIRRVADTVGDGIHFICPVHPNPNVGSVLERVLGDLDNVTLTPPLDYPTAIRVLSQSYAVVTDSGGLQEEAPSLGKPVLVLRDTTERPEGVDAGVAMLVGTDEHRVVDALMMLQDQAHYRRMATGAHPYGDGHAADRIALGLSKGFRGLRVS